MNPEVVSPIIEVTQIKVHAVVLKDNPSIT